MADPVLDEDNIIQLLNCPPLPATVSRFQSGAVQALIDLYDRKVTREVFSTAASSCLALYASAGRLYVLASCAALQDDGALDKKKFDDAMVAVQDVMRAQSETVIDMVKRLQLCPGDKDVLH